MSNYFIVMEFWGNGDPMFGGAGDDRVLGKAGSYLPRMHAPEDVAYFDTREQAEEAMAKTPKARIDGKPSIIPWTHQVRSGCGKNLEPGMLVSVGKAFRYNGKGGTYEPDELTGRLYYVTRLSRPGGRPDVATDVLLVAAEGCTPEIARQLGSDGDVWVAGHRCKVEG